MIERLRRIKKTLGFEGKSLRSRFKTIQVTSKHATTFPTFARLLTKETLYLQKILNDKKFSRCLDLGCGYGRLTNVLASTAKMYVGLEPERKLFMIAKELYPEQTFVCARADEIPYKDNCFDLIVSWTVLQHIYPSLIEKTVKEIKRVATNNAFIILTEYTGETTSNFTFGRRVEAYCRLMKPFVLTNSFQRYVYAGHNTGTVMIFRRKEKEEQ